MTGLLILSVYIWRSFQIVIVCLERFVADAKSRWGEFRNISEEG